MLPASGSGARASAAPLSTVLAIKARELGGGASKDGKPTCSMQEQRAWQRLACSMAAVSATTAAEAALREGRRSIGTEGATSSLLSASAREPSASDTRPSSATALQRADAGCTVRSPHDSTAAGARLCACAPCVALCCELGPRAEGWLVAFRRPTASALLNPERLAGTCAELSGCRHTCTAARALSSSPHIWPARLPVVAACLQAKAIIMRKRNRLPRCHRPALRLSLIGPTRRTRLYLTAAAPRGSIQARGPAPPVRASSAPQDHANPAAGSHARETPRVCFLRAQHPAWQSRHVVGPLPSRTPQGHPARENGRERASRVAAAGPTAPASAASAALISDKSAMAAVRDQARPLLPSLVLAARPDCWPAADLQQPSIGGAVI
jgi:hypothetical protein